MLVDTSVLARILQPRHPGDAHLIHQLQALPSQGETLYIVPQNLIELWVVATRPLAQNGFGFSTSKASHALDRMKQLFTLLPDDPAIYTVWESLVTGYQVSGKPAHDARLVAAMMVHGLSTILTFDKTGFTRFPNLHVLHPASLS